MWHTDAGGGATRGWYPGPRPPAGPGSSVPGSGAEPDAAPRDLVTVRARVGLEAVDILRLRAAAGPVLHDRSCDTLGFLVPPGTCAEWELPGSVCAPTCPPPGGSWGVRVAGVPEGLRGARGAAGEETSGAFGGVLGGAAEGAEWVEQPPVAGTFWLVSPVATALSCTQPCALRAALAEAARTVQAARGAGAGEAW